MKQTAINRLNKEMADLSQNPPEGAAVSLIDNNIATWRLDVTGPAGTPYAGGHFVLNVAIPDNYPFKPPAVTFQTRIFHPNVSRENGSICADVYENSWAPTLNVRFVIDAVLAILMNPNPEHNVDAESAQMLSSNPALFNQTAAQWTQQYAR